VFPQLAEYAGSFEAAPPGAAVIIQLSPEGWTMRLDKHTPLKRWRETLGFLCVEGAAADRSAAGSSWSQKCRKVNFCSSKAPPWGL
jgi:hypothetical protein